MTIYIAIAFLLISLVAGGFVVYILLRQKRYTRNIFAFAALSTLSAILLLITTSVFSEITPWEAVLVVISKIFGFDFKVAKPGASEYVLIGVTFFILADFARRIHQNWDGLVTLEQHNQEKRQESISLTQEGLNELLRLIKRSPPPEIYQPLETGNLPRVLNQMDEPLDWHRQACDLLKLKSKNYVFNEDAWDSENHCWVGHIKQTKNPIFLHCSQEGINKNDVNAFLEHVKIITNESSKQLNQIKVVLAAKNGPKKEELVVNGIKIYKENEESLLENLIDFTDYFSHIQERVEESILPDSTTITLDQMYTPSNYRFDKKDDAKENIETFLNSWVSESSTKQIALLGEYGQGKSTCALIFSYHMIKNIRNSPRIPILIELRGTSPKNLTVENLLAIWAEKFDINPRALKKLLIAGKLLIVFDGFDEMELIGDIEMRLNHFRTLWKFCYPKSKILITGRPNLFLDDKEMKTALGIHNPHLEKPYCQAIHLLPFNLNQIRNALKNSPGKIKDEICSLAKKDEKFLEIASRPSLLYILNLLWEKENLSAFGSEMNAAQILEIFINHSYHRQDLKAKNGPNFMVLNVQERDYFMRGIASFMASNSLPNQIGKDGLHNIVIKLLEKIPDSISTSNAMEKENRPLRERLPAEEDKAIDNIQNDVRTCGILVVDFTKPGTFKFAHKSFMEYLFARTIADQILNKKLEDSELEASRAITVTTYANISDILSYPESATFLAELLTNFIKKSQDAKTNKIISELFNIIFQPVFKFFIFLNPIFRIQTKLLLLIMTRSMGQTLFKERNFENSQFKEAITLSSYARGKLFRRTIMVMAGLFSGVIFFAFTEFFAFGIFSGNLGASYVFVGVSGFLYPLVFSTNIYIFSPHIRTMCLLWFMCCRINKSTLMEVIEYLRKDTPILNKLV